MTNRQTRRHPPRSDPDFDAAAALDLIIDDDMEPGEVIALCEQRVRELRQRKFNARLAVSTAGSREIMNARQVEADGWGAEQRKAEALLDEARRRYPGPIVTAHALPD